MAITNNFTLGVAYNVVSDCAEVTGITASGPVIIKSIEIPPNNFGTGDIVTIQAVLSKAGTSGGYYYGVYWNISNTLTNARKVLESINPTNDGVYIPSTYTYSNLYYRMQIVSLTQSTRVYDPYYTYTGATAGKGTDLFFRNTTTPGSVFEQVGTQEALTSIDWSYYNGTLLRGGFFIIAGGCENPADRLRCEWIKIANLTTGTFQDVVR